MNVQMARYSEQPALWDSISDLSSEVWPEYNRHGDVLSQYWNQLYETFPEWQFVLFDPDAGEVLAEGHTVPVAWDGTDAALGPGIDASLEAGFALRAAGGSPTALCALAAEIPPRHQRRGLSAEVLRAMAGLAARGGTGSPDRAGPAVPQGALPDHPDRAVRGLDPGGRDAVRPVAPGAHPARRTPRAGPPRSMRITGSVADWESWTRMRFPETGDYVFPAGLATVRIDRGADTGQYWEPNVWLVHRTRPPAEAGGTPRA